MRFQICLFSFFVLLLQAHCARELTPTGGPPDKDAPRMDSVRSTRNYQTNFVKSDIEFRFNEWLQLKDVSTQVFVSPPTQKKPQVTLEGKKIRVHFDDTETLRTNTTYTIHFGNAIQDLNEGNAVKDMRFVFSTGPNIDSLSVSGKITNALTGEPVKGASVVLHSDISDSATMKQLPDYLAFTDAAGAYVIQNVHEGKYALTAYLDENKNNKWSAPLEEVAFADAPIEVDTGEAQAPPMVMFKTNLAQKLITKQVNQFGQVRLVYTSNTGSMVVRSLTDSAQIFVVPMQDSILIWYDHALNHDWQLLSGTDTINIRPLQRTDWVAGHELTFAVGDQVLGAKAGKGRANATTAPLAKNPLLTNQLESAVTTSQSGRFSFSGPIAKVDTALWVCIAVTDSVAVRNFSVQTDSVQPTQIVLGLPAQKTELYRFMLLPGAVTDLWGVPNTDTLRAAFRMIVGEEVGQLNLIINSLRPGGAYLLELSGPAEYKKNQAFRSETGEMKLGFDALLPGQYIAKVFDDLNGNGRWDSGDFFKRRAPEPVFTQSLEAVRPNWVIEATMSLSGKKGKVKF
jgi:uncharacterized protein (DUF2141 family)